MREKEPWCVAQEGHRENDHIKSPSSLNPGCSVNYDYPAVQINE